MNKNHILNNLKKGSFECQAIIIEAAPKKESKAITDSNLIDVDSKNEKPDYEYDYPSNYDYDNDAFSNDILCPMDWVGYGGKCYFFSNKQTANFKTSREICQSKGGDILHDKNSYSEG